MAKIRDIEVEFRLRPARVQQAADRQVEEMIALVNRTMNLTDEEREEMAEAIRALAR